MTLVEQKQCLFASQGITCTFLHNCQVLLLSLKVVTWFTLLLQIIFSIVALIWLILFLARGTYHMLFVIGIFFTRSVCLSTYNFCRLLGLSVLEVSGSRDSNIDRRLILSVSSLSVPLRVWRPLIFSSLNVLILRSTIICFIILRCHIIFALLLYSRLFGIAFVKILLCVQLNCLGIVVSLIVALLRFLTFTLFLAISIL
jgi:hypothetical protein